MLTACQRDEERFASPRTITEVEKNFFTKGYIESLNPHITNKHEIAERSPGVLDSVYNALMRANNEHNFIPHFVDLFGYPAWQLALILEDSIDTETQVALPFFHEYDTLITGLFYARIIQGTVELSDFFVYDETADIVQENPQAGTWEVNVHKIVTSSILNEIIFDNLHQSDAYHDWILDAVETFELNPGENSIQVRGSGLIWCFWICVEWAPDEGQSDGTGWYWVDKKIGNASPVPVNTNARCITWARTCIELILPDIPDWDRFANMNPGGGSTTGGSPTVNLEPHLNRIEACGGLGDPYDYGPSNPGGQHPDQVFCEQLQQLYDCLPFLAADEELIAWYLWYDETYPGDTWTELFNFGSGSHMSPVLKDKAIRLWKSLYPFNFQPSIDTWTEFKTLWNLIANIENDNEISLSAAEEEWLVVTHSDNGILSELSQLLDSYHPYILDEELEHLQNATSIFLKHEMDPVTISEEQAYVSVVGAIPPGWAWSLAVRTEYLSLKLEHCLHTYDPGSGEVTFSNCEWSETRLRWTAGLNVLMEGLHSILQIAGFIPGAGEIADLTDGIIYSIQGDGFNAALSFSSTLPIAGWGASTARFAARTITGPSGRSLTFKYLRETISSVITFGDRGQLRRVLGLEKGNPLVAHHLIPWGQSGHELVQKAAKADAVTLADGTVLEPWHMNDALNGIPLDYGVHSGNHQIYTNTILQKMNQLNGQISTNEEALSELFNLSNQIRTWILNNPGVHIDNIVL